MEKGVGSMGRAARHSLSDTGLRGVLLSSPCGFQSLPTGHHLPQPEERVWRGLHENFSNTHTFHSQSSVWHSVLDLLVKESESPVQLHMQKGGKWFGGRTAQPLSHLPSLQPSCFTEKVSLFLSRVKPSTSALNFISFHFFLFLSY